MGIDHRLLMNCIIFTFVCTVEEEHKECQHGEKPVFHHSVHFMRDIPKSSEARSNQNQRQRQRQQHRKHIVFEANSIHSNNSVKSKGGNGAFHDNNRTKS